MHFKLHEAGDCGVVEITLQALDASSPADALGNELYELVDRKGHKNIVLDLANVRFLASRALGVMVTLRQKIEYAKGQIVICGLRKDLLPVFKFAHLDELFAFYDTRESAVASFARSGHHAE